MKLDNYHGKKIIFILLISTLLAGIFYYLWENQNIGINKKYVLSKSVKKYSELIEVGLPDQAYNLYLTTDAKNRVTYRFEDAPLTDQEKELERIRIQNCPRYKDGRIYNGIIDWSCVYDGPKEKQIQVEVSSLENFTKYATKRKNEWKNVRIDKIIFPGKNRADVKLLYSNGDSIETWFYINGKWLRDF